MGGHIGIVPVSSDENPDIEIKELEWDIVFEENKTEDQYSFEGVGFFSVLNRKKQVQKKIAF